MHICYAVPEFVTEDESGGLGTYIDNISRALADKGHRIDVFVTSFENKTFEYYSNIDVHRVKVELGGLDMDIPGIVYREWSKRINEVIEREQNNGAGFDIVQYANWRAFGLDRTNIPSVVRISSDLPYWRAASAYEYDKNNIPKCTKITDYLEDIALMRADGVLSPSYLLSEIIGNRCNVDIGVIESPFNLCGRNESQKLFNEDYFFTFGTIKYMKGIRVIGESIFDLLEKYPETLYVFAGHNSTFLDENGQQIDGISYLKRKAGKHANRIRYLGKINREDICKLAADAKTCILPSRIDNLPNTCIEAMASGGIVIGTRGASFEQIIEDGQNGFLVEIENKIQLREAVDKVFKLNESQRTEMQRKAKERITKMDASIIADKMVEFYGRVISCPRNNRNTEYYSMIKNKYNNEIMKYSSELVLK